MTDKFCCGICEHYQAELRAVLATSELADIQPLILPARCGHPPLRPAELTASFNHLTVPCDTVYLLGGTCLNPIITSADPSSPPTIIHDMRATCFSLFVNTAILDEQIRRGAYLITPGWLRHWQAHIEEWGFDQETARAFFAEWATTLLLLDTGIDPQAPQHLRDLADFLQMPAATLPVGLDVFQSRIEAKLHLWRVQRQQRQSDRELSEASKKLADYAMLSHALNHIAATPSERDVIQRILEIFTMLCAPRQVCYLPMFDGTPGTLSSTNPESQIAPEAVLRHLPGDAPYAWMPSHNGFYLRIAHHDDTVGIIHVDHFTFPRYADHYLNLAQNIAALCGLAIVNARRYQHLAQANQELRAAKDAADSASRAKSLFLSNMGHEFRTPLNGILGYAQLLLRDPTLSASQREQLDVLKRSGEHLLNLVVDILEIANLETNHFTLQSAAFPFAPFVQRLAEIIEVRAAHKRLAFELDADLSRLPDVVWADEKRLRQILLNVLDNAVKFTEHGRVTLHIHRLDDERDQAPDAATWEARLRFEVSDTGIGIAPEHIEAVFAPFEQPHHPHYYAEGTGLGLAICRRFVRLMGSDLYVRSVQGEGSTFGFVLNLKASRRAQPSTDSAAEDSSGAFPPDPQPADRPTTAQFTLPPLEDLETLHELAVIGDVFGIHNRLDALDRDAPQYAEFIAIIRQHAKTFHIATIQALLHDFISASRL